MTGVMSLPDRLRNDLSDLSAIIPVLGFGIGTEPNFFEQYREHLFRLHAVVRASVPLMQSALHKCNPHTESALVEYFREQIGDEQQHDAWLVEDLVSIDAQASNLFLCRPPISIAELVGMQYYWINHYDKVALLGYIAALESNPPSLECIEQVISASGLPREAFRTLLHHAHIDPSHVERLSTLLGRINFSEDQERLIIKNGLWTSLRMRTILGAPVEAAR